MRRKHRYFAGVIAVALMLSMVFSTAVMASEQVDREVLDARNGVVKIQFFMKDAAYYAVAGRKLYPIKEMGDMLYSSGTGFFIGESGKNPEFLVTNEHVVDEYVNDAGYGGQFGFETGDVYTENEQQYPVVLASPSCELRVYYSENEYDVAIVDVPGDQEREDLALLKLKDGPTDKRVPLKLKLLSGEVTTTPVFAIGFPGNLENAFTSSSKFNIDDITVEPGQITHEPKTDDYGVERFPISAVIRHGNSGGPLVTDDGYVIGVNTNGWGNEEEMSYYSISSRTLKRFLERANVDFELVEGTDATEASSEENSGEDGQTEEESENSDSSQSSIVEWIKDNAALAGGIGAAVLVVIILIVVLSKKNKPAQQIQPTVMSQTPPPAPTPAVAPAPAPKKNAMLRSLSTQHNGMTVAVHVGSQVMIGRDPANCKVVFREGTEGVSGRHCSISYDPATDEFILTDLRSTYGTFLMNGQKLNPNVPYRLKAGDGFYVGAQENSFRVEIG